MWNMTSGGFLKGLALSLLFAFVSAHGECGECTVYEAKVQGPEDCTRLEEYDPGKGVCFFTCEGEECARRMDAIEAELETLEIDRKALNESFREGAFEGAIEAVYRIEPGERYVLVQGEENEVHRKVRRWLKAITPGPFSDRHLARLIFYHDRPGEEGEEDFVTFASVEPDAVRSKWKVYINLAALTLGEKEAVFTVIHELFHVYTLNISQINVNVSPRDCRGYSDGEVCYRLDSYLNRFYERFWKSSDARGPSAFVTEYAATGPEEDIAESFSAFVLRRKPKAAKALADTKVLFFYAYPELLELRRRVRRELLPLVEGR